MPWSEDRSGGAADGTAASLKHYLSFRKAALRPSLPTKVGGQLP